MAFPMMPPRRVPKPGTAPVGMVPGREAAIIMGMVAVTAMQGSDKLCRMQITPFSTYTRAAQASACAALTFALFLS